MASRIRSQAALSRVRPISDWIDARLGNVREEPLPSDPTRDGLALSPGGGAPSSLPSGCRNKALLKNALAPAPTAAFGKFSICDRSQQRTWFLIAKGVPTAGGPRAASGMLHLLTAIDGDRGYAPSWPVADVDGEQTCSA